MTSHVVVLSGGLDSSTLLARVRHENVMSDIYAISFNYGQRHMKELDFAKIQADEAFCVGHHVVDMRGVGALLAAGGSSLVSDTEVPEGHYAADNMKATVVPNRNMIMASIAAGYGIALGAATVWMGVHAGDHFIYPDCRPEFFDTLNGTIYFGNQGFMENASTDYSYVQTPFINLTKNDIAAHAVALDVDIANTWSCYKGGDMHCGKCGTCVERCEALESVENFTDPTKYEDRDYWKTVVKTNGR